MMQRLITGLVIVLALAATQGRGAAPVPEAAAGDASNASPEVEWLTDFAKAKAEAARRNVPILADFTGSDWCGWCIKLDKEVFSTAEFKAYAKDHVVLFLADFPARKPQPDELKTQNKALAETYGIRGFPTVLLLDAEGNKLAQTGYRRGGPEPYVEHLEELVETHWKPAPAEPSDEPA